MKSRSSMTDCEGHLRNSKLRFPVKGKELSQSKGEEKFQGLKCC